MRPFTVPRTKPESIKYDSTCKVLFLNWHNASNPFETSDLRGGIDFESYRIVFFDPLGFAADHGFRPETSDISLASYVGCTEANFRRYLAGIKAATAGIQRLLENGGIFVIRAQIPNVQFKIRKKSSIGTQSYTESIVSPFFWLQEFLGNYSFEYCSKNTLEFLDRRGQFARIFGRYPINCLQTLDSIPGGRVDVIAQTATTPKHPVVSGVSFDSMPGRIFLVPQFLVRDEEKRLVDAFKSILFNKTFGVVRPAWVESLESDLDAINPFRAELERLDRQISSLENERILLLEKVEETMRLVDLLVETGLDLAEASRVALGVLGFEILEAMPGKSGGMFEVVFNGDRIRRAIVKTAACDQGPIRAHEISELVERIELSSFHVKPKGILIGNAWRLNAPTEREIWFDMECLDDARKHDICLVPSSELYSAACHCLVKKGSDVIDDIASSLCRDLIGCDSQFELDRKRYNI